MASRAEPGYGARVRRLVPIVLLIGALLPATWLRSPPPPRHEAITIEADRLPVTPGTRLGPFRLAEAWRLDSRDWRFGGYSALLPLPGGELLAISDGIKWLRFRPPAASGSIPATFGGLPLIERVRKDSESAARDPADGTLWIGFEGSNAITRSDGRSGALRVLMPPQMRDWGNNRGAETMVRLNDGRFLLLREGFSGWLDRRDHRGLLFPGDPFAGGRAAPFSFAGPAGYMPTDAAQLPDGRVLVLMRRLVWPLPVRTDGVIVLADPAAIVPGRDWPGTVIARFARARPVANFEASAVTPASRGLLDVWLLADDNKAVTQQTILWRLELDPARLPAVRASKKARGATARPSAKPAG